MFLTLRTRFGIPGVISVIALVFAMFGGAYAASNSSGGGKATASAKAKQGPRGPKGPAGPAGPAGLAGPAGAVGPKGDAGAVGPKGDPGAAGASGQGVTVTTVGPAGDGVNCVGVGGAKFVAGSAKAYACNGAEGQPGNPGASGSPWVVGAAPAGALLKGTWSIPQYTAAAASEEIPVPISTSVPIAQANAIFTFFVPEGAAADPNNQLGCTGTAEEPKATPVPGLPSGATALCVYEEKATNLGSGFASGDLVGSGGGVVTLPTSEAAGPVSAYGSWAMLAP